jgi:hypothetical protein
VPRYAALRAAARHERWVFIATALLGLAACTPLRVDVAEQPAGGFVATALGDDAEACRDARTRVAEEARYHCEARGARTSLGKVSSEPDGAGCRVELPFWCTGASR